MGALTTKGGDFLSPFHEIDESEAQLNNTTLKPNLVTNHDVAESRGKMEGKLPLEHNFGFRKTLNFFFKKVGFPPTFKTADLQDKIYTTLDHNFVIKIGEFFFYVFNLIPDAQIQILFNDLFKRSFTLSFDSRSTDRKTVDTQLKYQVDIGSTENVNIRKYLIVIHQTVAKVGVANKANNMAGFW